MKSLSCPNGQCSLSGKSAVGHIIRYGFYTTKVGKRRRYQCRTCGKTFCSTCGTPYYRLQHRRATFDGVASLSVEGVNKSAIARVKQIAWNTVHRWLERAARCCRRFSNRKIKGLSIPELQADEIRKLVGTKERQVWVFVVTNESRNCSSHYHGWIRILREGGRTSLWASVCLRPGDQDA